MICWQKRCVHVDHDDVVFAGRTKSGRRWFWVVALLGDGGLVNVAHGHEDTEGEAVAAYTAAAEQAATGRLLRAIVQAGVAVDARKRAGDAQRALKPAPDTSETTPVEYLYGVHWWRPGQVVSFPVTRKTAKRVFYQRGRDRGIGSVDRASLERDGVVRNRARHVYEADHELYSTPEGARAQLPAAPEPGSDLKALRRAAAEAHPDRGGTHEGFLKANARYEAAKRRAAVRQVAGEV